jgi:tRNA 2-thiouridine synthesizing protein E
MTQRSEIHDNRFDEDGFLYDPSLWNPRLAQNIAQHDGITELEYRHWIMIAEMRKYYYQYHTPPAMHFICHHSHLGSNCAGLFHHNAREAWRIAGLPNPGEEAKAYL